MQLTILWEGYTEEHNQRSVLRYLDNNVESMRERYSQWINSIGDSIIDGATISERLETSGGHNLWLMSGLFEKSLYKHPFIVDCLKLFALEEILISQKPSAITINGVSQRIFRIVKEMTAGLDITLDGEPLEDESHSSIKSRLKKFFFALPYPVQGFAWFFAYCLRNFSLRKSQVDSEEFDSNSTTFIFSYFIHLDRKGLENGEFISGHWDQLPQLINKKGYDIHFLHHFLLSGAVKTAAEGVNFLSLLNKPTRNKNIHQFVDSRISLSVIMRVLKAYFRIKLPVREAKLFFVSDKSKLNLWPILEHEWKSSVYGYTAFQNLLWIELMEKYFDRPVKYKTGFYLLENQGWERAFVHSWQRNGHQTLTAVQHGIVREWDVRYFNFESNNKKQGRRSFRIPEPDFYAINGPAAWTTLAKADLPEDSMLAGEALRYNVLLDVLVSHSPVINNSDILLLGDYQMGVTLKMMDAVREASLSLNCKFNFTLKCHPACPIDITPYQTSMNIVLIEDQLFKVLPRFSYVIATGATTAALDAFISGTAVLVFLENDTVNLSPLKGIKDAVFATGADDVKRFLSAKHHSVNTSIDNEFFWLDKELSRWKLILDKLL